MAKKKVEKVEKVEVVKDTNVVKNKVMKGGIVGDGCKVQGE